MNIVLGAMAAPLKEQLAGRLDEKTLGIMDDDTNAITRLLLRGFIPESIGKKARQKLIRAIHVRLGSV